MILAISYSLTLCWSHFGLSNLSALLLFLLLELLEMHPSMIWCHIAGPAASHFFQLIHQNTDGFPGQPRNIISSACPGSTLVPPLRRFFYTRPQLFTCQPYIHNNNATTSPAATPRTTNHADLGRGAIRPHQAYRRLLPPSGHEHVA